MQNQLIRSALPCSQKVRNQLILCVWSCVGRVERMCADQFVGCVYKIASNRGLGQWMRYHMHELGADRCQDTIKWCPIANDPWSTSSLVPQYRVASIKVQYICGYSDTAAWYHHIYVRSFDDTSSNRRSITADEAFSVLMYLHTKL